MVKTVRLEPIAQNTEIQTNANLLSALLQEDLHVLKECGGRGMCATCHVYIKDGMESLSGISKREQRTLEVITTAKPNSRLACQSRVLGEGVVVEVPAGMYIDAIEDIEALIGRRTEQPLLHPLTGEVVVESGKLITRSVITQLKDVRLAVGETLARTRDA
ncbi:MULTISPECIES: 2Fe-2S iron-sulfur cluster-binding protein [Planktothricoides]|uniref:2Fe-2S iron-sulfur cluster-binding protein n=2 Tax=Planktothricoides raciborskii TaxID=132608 RepID=A0AAU8J8P7_9CYAN|nr:MULTISPECIES: 2Fe-2S iron-sulfur cluster-binding protein [Planktothricoides]KOR38390.1 (2Fe-2S)-binding protein [Planktothricoides sp. SR001]MBD2546404.1 2Fe-2S iron-sulfur cluster binding domain-containing protein [Planktothricoides raciborskii FACHB-1370]MBD2584802.1 2Fe-2S iron-sulfur cluster binding domain-containing protein [Planktothricoides raciborskii FACHB-1261]